MHGCSEGLGTVGQYLQAFVRLSRGLGSQKGAPSPVLPRPGGNLLARRCDLPATPLTLLPWRPYRGDDSDRCAEFLRPPQAA